MKKEVSEAVVVPVPVELAYKVWADFERFPQWMDHLVHVERTGKRTSRWVMRREDGGTAEWTTEVTVAQPSKELAWSSVDGDLITYGRVLLEPLGPRQTRVTVARFHAVGRRRDPKVLATIGNPAAKLRQDLAAYARHVQAVASGAPRHVPPPGLARPSPRGRAPAPAARAPAAARAPPGRVPAQRF